jgi:hypothetical protein
VIYDTMSKELWHANMEETRIEPFNANDLPPSRMCHQYEMISATNDLTKLFSSSILTPGREKR